MHVDLSPVKASANSCTDRTAPQSPIAARRPPLLTKSSLNIVTTSEDLLAQDVGGKKGGYQSSGKAGKAAAGKGPDASKRRTAKPPTTQNRPVKEDVTDSEEEEEVIVVPQRRAARVADRSSSTKPSTSLRARSQKLLSVEIPVSRPRPPRAATPARESSVPPEQVSGSASDVNAVESRLAELRLNSTAGVDPLEELLAVCDSHEVETFDALRSVLAPQTNHAHRTTIVKVGEASFSEVYGVLGGSTADQGTVVKVVPLGPGHFNRSDKLPDCSDPVDVLREIEITRKLSGTASGGFVDYKQ